MKANWKRFVALFLALTMIAVSGVVFTNDGFKANDEGRYESLDKQIFYDGNPYQVNKDNKGEFIIVSEAIFMKVKQVDEPSTLEPAEDQTSAPEDASTEEPTLAPENTSTEQTTEPENTSTEQITEPESTLTEEQTTAPEDTSTEEQTAAPEGAPAEEQTNTPKDAPSEEQTDAPEGTPKQEQTSENQNDDITGSIVKAVKETFGGIVVEAAGIYDDYKLGDNQYKVYLSWIQGQYVEIQDVSYEILFVDDKNYPIEINGKTMIEGSGKTMDSIEFSKYCKNFNIKNGDSTIRYKYQGVAGTNVKLVDFNTCFQLENKNASEKNRVVLKYKSDDNNDYYMNISYVYIDDKTGATPISGGKYDQINKLKLNSDGTLEEPFKSPDIPGYTCFDKGTITENITATEKEGSSYSDYVDTIIMESVKANKLGAVQSGTITGYRLKKGESLVDDVNVIFYYYKNLEEVPKVGFIVRYVDSNINPIEGISDDKPTPETVYYVGETVNLIDELNKSSINYKEKELPDGTKYTFGEIDKEEALKSYTLSYDDLSSNDGAVVINVVLDKQDDTPNTVTTTIEYVADDGTDLGKPKEIREGRLEIDSLTAADIEDIGEYRYAGDENVTVITGDDGNTTITILFTKKQKDISEYNITVNYYVKDAEGKVIKVGDDNAILGKNGLIDGVGIDKKTNEITGAITTPTVKQNDNVLKIKEIVIEKGGVTTTVSELEGKEYITIIGIEGATSDVVINVFYEAISPILDEEEAAPVLDEEVATAPGEQVELPQDTIEFEEDIDTPVDKPENLVEEEEVVVAETPEEPVAVVVTPAPVAIPVGNTTAVEVMEDENGNLTLTQVDDVEAALADMDLGHLCNILYFIILLATTVTLYLYFRSVKKHQRRIFELRSELGEDDPYRKENKN